MAIDGVIILDSAGRPIIQSGFRSTTSAYPLLHIEALNDAISKASRPTDVDPVLYVSSLQFDNPSACCHIKCGELRVMCPISGDVDPLYGFAFLQTFIEILHEYLGHVSAETLRENFDIVYQLLEETLDSGGHPLTTSPNALRDIVIPPSLLNKMLSVAGVSSLANPSAHTHPFASPIPWRKAGVRYNNNEIYFDVTEDLRAVINKYVIEPQPWVVGVHLVSYARNGTPSVSTVWGKVQSNCKLSGTPDLLLSLSNSQSLTDCSFHPCVRLQRWARDKALSFVPPDGHFTLMEYRYTPKSVASTAQHLSLPFTLRTDVQIEENGGTFDLTLNLTGRTMDSISVEFFLGTGASGASCMASQDASYTYDPINSILRWEIKSAPTSSSYTLRGSFTSTSKVPRPSRAFRIRFEIPRQNFSAVKVDQLKLTGEAYKPYKGMRASSRGDVEWRWC